MTISRVYDGDTLALADGRKIRVIGINTPELARKRRPAQPFAADAQRTLRQITRKHQMQIGIKLGTEQLDRYGRTLAHIFTPDGHNIGHRLTQMGLAFANPHPPNLWEIDCYIDAEKDARRNKVGLWGNNPIVNAKSLNQSSGGFHLVRGQITQTQTTRAGLRYTLDQRLNLLIERKFHGLFGRAQLNMPIGASIIARGWISSRKGRLTMRIRHPKAIENP